MTPKEREAYAEGRRHVRYYAPGRTCSMWSRDPTDRAYIKGRQDEEYERRQEEERREEEERELAAARRREEERAAGEAAWEAATEAVQQPTGPTEEEKP